MKIKRKFKIILIIVLTLVLIGVLSYGGYKVYKTVKGETVATVTVSKEIPEYGYTLRDDASKYYKSLFENLTETLSTETVDEQEYAKLVAQMLVTDFYTINNKLSKTDVGGTEFILAAYKENFVDEAEDKVYKYVEQNVYGDRTQQLPEVTATEVKDIQTSTYAYEDFTDENVYVVTVGVTYKEDLGYPTEVTIKMLHQDKKLEVFYMK